MFDRAQLHKRIQKIGIISFETVFSCVYFCIWTQHFIMSFFCIIQKFDVAFYQVFVGARLHVTGGSLKGGRLVEREAAVAGKFFFSQLLSSFFSTVIILKEGLYCNLQQFFTVTSVGHCCWCLVGQKWASDFIQNQQGTC